MIDQGLLKRTHKKISSSEYFEAYNVFKKVFLDKDVQENIYSSNEEQYQEGFLKDLFVNVLGYTLNPSVDYNLKTEIKNVKNSKKADAAILDSNNVIAVIELKGTDTIDLDKVETQAFGYKNNQRNCRYVITSNFRYLRLYIDDSIENIQFDLFNLSFVDFKSLYLLISKDSIFRDVPSELKYKTQRLEDKITKEFYMKYSSFRLELITDIEKKNNITDISLILKSTQKLLDRFLFLFFAEDTDLIPEKITEKILKDYDKITKEYDLEVKLYDRFKKYFSYLDKGRETENEKIFAYNGGLFETDDFLDSLELDDKLLYDYTKALSSYDFGSQIGVDILGHIFEQSISEIEKIKSINSNAQNNIGKRKKDGVFYTPKYVTKYIVDQSLGKYCRDYRRSIDIDESEYIRSRKNRKKSTIKILLGKLNDYRKFLLQLKILDPAVGSGAFLIEALEFLIREHSYIDRLNKFLFSDSIPLSDISDKILERNLYGVDINVESTEITKLSLWLRTARVGQKLVSLNERIVCENSLLQNGNFQLADVFNETGVDDIKFDVVIGNPPYGADLDANTVQSLQRVYDSFEYQVNTYALFYEVGMRMLKKNGILGYVTPASFLHQPMFESVRTYIQRFEHKQIVKNYYEVFSDAVIGDSAYVFLKNAPNSQNIVRIKKVLSRDQIDLSSETVSYHDLVDEDNLYNFVDKISNYELIKKDGISLAAIANVTMGIKPYQTGKGNPKQTKDIVKAKPFNANFQVSSEYMPCLVGREFHRYRFYKNPDLYIKYGSWLAEPRENAPFFDDKKIVIRQTSDKIIATIDENKWVNLNNVYNVGLTDKDWNIYYLLGCLNSSIVNRIYQYISQEKGKAFAEVKKAYLVKIPIAHRSNPGDRSKELISR